MSTITIKSPADFHVHLRQGSLSQLIGPHVRKGGFDVAYVMVGTLGFCNIEFKQLTPTLAQSQASDHKHRASLAI